MYQVPQGYQDPILDSGLLNQGYNVVSDSLCVYVCVSVCVADKEEPFSKPLAQNSLPVESSSAY